ncbi:DUF2840 domain-containing protein [Hyphomonas sp.]|uniref:DUF2840 domain-containing protein n=1 Tax=Hyphomonas sp. TaxID=87 RepID=UPI0025B8A6E4|nr:DUF2840 domain-containing protein [Hyphomonas sp.]
MRRDLTAVIIQYRKNRINHRLVFGEPILTVRRGWHRKLAVFNPGQIFGYERWLGNKYGTQSWETYVLLAVSFGPVTRVKGVIPGAEILLRTTGKTRAKRVLGWLQEQERSGLKPSQLSAHYWRHAHNAFETGRQPHVLTTLQSRAFETAPHP